MRVLIAVVGLCLVLTELPATAETPAVLVNRKAPEWRVTRWWHKPGTGADPSVRTLRGRVVYLLAFRAEDGSAGWASLEQLVGRTAGARDVSFVALQIPSASGGRSQPAAALALARRLKVPVGQAADGFAASYGIRRTPWVEMIDKSGIVHASGKPLAVDAALRQIERLRRDPQARYPLVGEPWGENMGLRWFTKAGGPVRFQDHELTLVRWWTWHCPHCSASVPELSGLWRKYKSRGLHAVMVFHPKSPFAYNKNNIAATLRRYRYDGDFAFDDKWTKLRDLKGRARLRGATSVSFLVDKDGIVRWAHPGPRIHRTNSARWRIADASYEDLDARLDALLPKQ